MQFLKRNSLWVIYFLFIAVMMVNHEGEHLLFSQGPYPYGKYFIWLLYLGFLGYSIYCSKVENFFRTVKKIFPLLWARQIGIDLYMGLVLSMGIIYFHEGSILVVLIWLIPVLFYANLAILPYMAMNYDSIIANFL